jgi:hypothetical protein
MDIAPLVSEIIATEAAQAIVQEEGYNGIEYVAPLAATVDPATGEEKVVYPWHKGIPAAELSSSVEEDDVEYEFSPHDDRLQAVCEGLTDVFQANGVRPKDLRPDHLLITEETNTLALLDAEMYVRIDTGSPTYDPGQTRQYTDNQWQDILAPGQADMASPLGIPVEPGAMATGRASEEDGGALLFEATLAGGRVITLANRFTGESAVIHVPASEIRTVAGEQAIIRAVTELPSLKSEGAVAHVIAETDIPVSSETGWTNYLMSSLRKQGLFNVKEMITGRGKVVRVNDTGRIEVCDLQGGRTITYQPLPPQRRHLPLVSDE